MYIADIHIDHFRHLQNVRLGPFDPPGKSSDLVVLAGPNGGGKSSVLELIGFALSSSWSLGWALSRSFPENAFEVALGITNAERKLIFEYLGETKAPYKPEVRTYLDNNSIYYRSYNYTSGEYQKNANLYNEIHNLCSSALRNHYKRSLGFFLKSERYYPHEAFRREQLFKYERLKRQDHVWKMAFNTSHVQYTDMFEFLVQQRYHYFRELGKYHHQVAASEMGEGRKPPADPLLIYDELLQKLFPHYSFSDQAEEIPSNLFVQLPSGGVIPFSDLSSGEKEVFFLLSFFVRHNVESAVIVIDEPELHLHPELARLLVRIMQSVRPGNQIWLATHNTEIIDEAGRDRVTYLARDPCNFQQIVTSATDESEALLRLKDLFGYSGYVGVSKRMVFLEGQNSSADRKLFANLFAELGGSIKFIPANSSENQAKINAAILAILESEIGWVTFYLVRDRDYLPDEAVAKYNNHSSGRIRVLKRHEIENYLLDEKAISIVLDQIFNQIVSPDQVLKKLREIVRNISGEVLRDMVAYRLNLLYRPQDFSLGSILSGQSIVEGDESDIKVRLDALASEVQSIAGKVNDELHATTTRATLQEMQDQCKKVVSDAASMDDQWKALFPGKRLLDEVSKTYGLGKTVVLQNSLIKHLADNPERVPGELVDLVTRIDSGVSLR